MRLDRWLGTGLVLLALAWLWLSYNFIPGARAAGEPGPRAFPLLLGVLLALLGILLAASAAGRGAGGHAVQPATRRELTVAGGTFAALMLYAFLLDKLGFVIATPLVVLLLMRVVMGARSWLLTLGMAGGITLACWAFFALLLEAPLPRGAWLLLL